ncbi:proline dehydrogenase [Micromonospora sp. ATCC 39149]|uniref:Proline dehydrogenase family protein n=1 Tax=Micromonospora carbonacea TaxID=47853 RepID=A0A7D5Y7U4_9ACTN|nr:proline dehydrogenase family protein [Micromonospora sp. ATCC 39149]EEP70458.1 proline dehydrogenase [Micromonospora sp. ATCC 39149]QLJ96860.1 proline dehydrogenase family protein [Micromonospora carbonacea]
MRTSNEAAAADVLRRWALDEELKHVVMSSPQLSAVASRIARRYTAGETIDDAIETARASIARGHRVSIEYAGESVRDAQVADAETEVFLALIERLRREAVAATVSFDLSHVGSLVDPALALRNARRIATAVERLGTTLMISAEGSDRTDLVLDLYDELTRDHGNVGITLQARLHRSVKDLDRLLDRPGPIRLVQGAFLESVDVAFPRGSAQLREAYLRFADRLIDSGHPTAIATHDADLVDSVTARHPDLMAAGNVEFEMLLGLGTQLHDRLRRAGFRTREYAVFGREWWLYVLNRIAEEPHRVYDAIVAAGARQS